VVSITPSLLYEHGMSRGTFSTPDGALQNRSGRRCEGRELAVPEILPRSSSP